MVLVAVLPWPLYLLLRQSLNPSFALMGATAVPAAWLLARCARRRRLDAVSALVLSAYALAVVLSFCFGDAVLPLKLRDVVALGAVGLVCFVSLALKRPLLSEVIQSVIRRDGAASSSLARRLIDPKFRHNLALATGLAGTIFLFAAGVEVFLISAVSTATFLALSGPIGGLTPVATAALVVAFLRWQTARGVARTPPPFRESRSVEKAGDITTAQRARRASSRRRTASRSRLFGHDHSPS